MFTNSRHIQHDLAPKHQQIDGTEAPYPEDHDQFQDFDRFADFAAFLDTFDVASLWNPNDELRPASRTDNNGDVFPVQHRRHRAFTYFLNKGSFSEEEKSIIQRYSHETPAVVMERLKDFDATTVRTYGQVKGAVDNERRKKNRRADNGPWTTEEIQTILRNMSLTPTELIHLLKHNVQSFRKNVDQVRDMKSMIAQKAKGRASRKKKSRQ